MEHVRTTDGPAAASAPVAPRWAVLAAYAVPLCVLPSAVWRATLVMSDELPWADRWYVLSLSAVSMGLALLTLGLVHRWGETLPRWLPLLGGRRVPAGAAVTAGTLGALAVTAICAYAVLNEIFDLVETGPVLIGNDEPDRNLHPPDGWVLAAYAPLVAWGPLLAAVTLAYHRRRTHRLRRPIAR